MTNRNGTTHIHNGSTTDAGNTSNSSGYRDPATPAVTRDTSGILTGGTHPAIQRQVSDVHGWSKDQRVLQLVSYLDETAMNVAQELGDNDLYNYGVLIKLLSDRFDPASRV